MNEKFLKIEELILGLESEDEIIDVLEQLAHQLARQNDQTASRFSSSVHFYLRKAIAKAHENKGE